jgi:crotonobetainyl-CoA:carnitine CoA-transferase CaiB-like acyl-CoA transferase
MDALDGLTVLDFTAHIAGPYGTKLLADLGARVIKVEKPGGDCSRRLGPWLGDREGPDRSGTFQFLNTNKESIVLDLSAPGATDVVTRLVTLSDLVVSAFPPRAAERLGVTYEAVRAAKDVPFAWVTNFGNSGPYRDYRLSDTVLFAMGGEMFSHGLAGREPLKLGGTAALLQCGAMAALAAMGAVTAYEVHGVGQMVELPLFEVQINNVDRRSSAILAWRFSGRENRPTHTSSPGLAGGIYPCADGYVEVTASVGAYWERFAAMVGEPRFGDPRWREPATHADPAARAEVDGVVYPWMLARTRAEIWERARAAHALVAPVYSGVDLFDDRVFRERGLWTEVEHAALGRFPMLGRPYRFERTPWRIRRAAPRLGEHTTTVLREAGFGAAEIDALFAKGVVA